MNGKEAAQSAAGAREQPAAATGGDITPTGVAELAALVDDIEGRAAAWAADTSRWLADSGKVTGTAIDKFIRPRVDELVHAPRALFAGAGFVAAAGLLGPDRSYIAWWQGDDMERVDALANFSPQSMDRYMRAEWFRIPVGTGKPHVTGPYIDLLCTDEYVLTFTHPVERGGEVAGVVGLDVTAQTFERAGLASLRRVGPTAVLVNAGGRSVISASLAVDAGDVVPPAAGAAVYPVGRQFRIYSATA